MAAFITGLTTGGLSSLAIRDGLLITSFERMVERGVAAQTVRKGSKESKLLVIGIFMVVNVLRMFTIHPIFRYFVHRVAPVIYASEIIFDQ